MADQDLRTLRTNFEGFNEEEFHSLSEMSMQESLEIWIELQNTYESQLRETASLFENDRRRYLLELQARLAKLST